MSVLAVLSHYKKAKWLPILAGLLSVMLFGIIVLLPIQTRAMTHSNLIGYWKFDELNAGDMAVDSSSHGNDATPVNGPTPDAEIPATMGGTFDDLRSISFDGSTQYLMVSNDGAFDETNAVSISVWVKFDNTAGYQTIIGRWHVGVEQQWLLQINSSGRFGFWTGDGAGGATDNLESTFLVQTDTWYHLAATATAGSKKLYVNGQLDNSNTAGTMGLAANTDVTIASKLSFGDMLFEYLDGKLDDLRVYDRILSATEAEALSNGEPIPPIEDEEDDPPTNQGKNNSPGTGDSTDKDNNNDQSSLTPQITYAAYEPQPQVSGNGTVVGDKEPKDDIGSNPKTATTNQRNNTNDGHLETDSSGAFLGLGWWWLLVFIPSAGLWWLLAGKLKQG